MKGVFYSLIAFMLVLPLIFYTVNYFDVINTQREQAGVKIRGDQFMDFTKSIFLDIPRMLEISGKQSMGIAINYIDENGEYLSSAGSVIAELVLNGTIYGNAPAMVPPTFHDWINAVTERGKKYGFNATIDIVSLTVEPYDSFHIVLKSGITVNITDQAGSMSVFRSYQQEVVIPISGFEDPLYALNTYGKEKRIIRAANITVQGVSSLDNAVGNHFYMASSQGPCFLDRLEGRLGISTGCMNALAGMESIVDLQDLISKGIPPRTSQTNVDYLYFDSAYHAGYPVNGTSYGMLKLDDEHAALYGVVLVK